MKSQDQGKKWGKKENDQCGVWRRCSGVEEALPCEAGEALASIRGLELGEL